MRYDLGRETDREAFKRRVNKLYEQGATAELREVKAKRSLSQNAIFHMWIAIIADSIGEADREALKRDIKLHLLGKRHTFNRLTGEEQAVDYHTSDLTKEEMSDFLSRLKAWADAEMGIYLPEAEDKAFAEMQERYL